MSLCNSLVFLYSIFMIVDKHAFDALSPLRNIFNYKDVNVSKYSYFSDHERLHYKEEAKKMFYYGYDNYMAHAFPEDELNPIYCRGRGPDYLDPSNININDVLGNYCLTLVDSLSTLAIIGNHSEFKLAVQRVIDVVHFDKNSTVQVFEANIRLLGALLSSHLLITDPDQVLGDLYPDVGYDNELLDLAHDLATRLLVAFEGSPTGLPFPRVHLQKGIPSNTFNSTCTAGAGSLLLEFGILSRLLRDPVYESVARRAMRAIRQRRSSRTGLVGNVLNVKTGDWEGTMSGIGAGLDSYFEYLLKAYILFGEAEDLQAFQEAYGSIKKYGRRGRADCNSGVGDHPMYYLVRQRRYGFRPSHQPMDGLSIGGISGNSSARGGCGGSHMHSRHPLLNMDEVWGVAGAIQLATQSPRRRLLSFATRIGRVNVFLVPGDEESLLPSRRQRNHRKSEPTRKDSLRIRHHTRCSRQISGGSDGIVLSLGDQQISLPSLRQRSRDQQEAARIPFFYRGPPVPIDCPHAQEHFPSLRVKVTFSRARLSPNRDSPLRQLLGQILLQHRRREKIRFSDEIELLQTTSGLCRY